MRRAQELQVQLQFAMESDDRNTVFWIERRGGRTGSPQRHRGPEKTGRQNVFLQATPIDVGPILRECLWSKLDAPSSLRLPSRLAEASNTSASGLGFEHARESVLPSHFDYENPSFVLCAA